MHAGSKDLVRRMVWRVMEEENIARFPRPVHGRIPNFAGAKIAAARLAETSLFRRADIIKANPDAPQRPVRLLALKTGKKVLMATPRLRRGFLLLDPSRIPSRLYGEASTIRGAFKHGVLLDTLSKLQALPKISLVVTGCVAVSPRHGERLGKGGGYSELEYAILREIGLVDEQTPIATTVHEAQLLEELPFEPHDLSVNLIATPRRLIWVEKPRPRPRGIYWGILDGEKLETIPLLRELQRHQ